MNLTGVHDRASAAMPLASMALDIIIGLTTFNTIVKEVDSDRPV